MWFNVRSTIPRFDVEEEAAAKARAKKEAAEAEREALAAAMAKAGEEAVTMARLEEEAMSRAQLEKEATVKASAVKEAAAAVAEAAKTKDEAAAAAAARAVEDAAVAAAAAKGNRDAIAARIKAEAEAKAAEEAQVSARECHFDTSRNSDRLRTTPNNSFNFTSLSTSLLQGESCQDEGQGPGKGESGRQEACGGAGEGSGEWLGSSTEVVVVVRDFTRASAGRVTVSLLPNLLPPGAGRKTRAGQSCRDRGEPAGGRESGGVTACG